MATYHGGSANSGYKTRSVSYGVDTGTGAPRVIQLTPEQQKAHAAILMERERERSQPSDRPKVVLTGGQPGSGKSYIVRSVGVEFEGMGGAVVIDPDEIRPTLPYMKEQIARGDLAIPNEANVDAGTIAYEMVQIAKGERRNLIIDGTLQNTKRAIDLATEMKDAGYDVQFHGMAVYPDLSHARTYTRREEQIAESPTGFGRGVSDEFHDQAVDGYRNTIEAFQTKSAVNSMTFYAEGHKTVETRLVDGQWTPALSMRDEIDQAQRRPDTGTMMAATDAWWMAARAMRERQAPAEEIGKVDSYRHLAILRERQVRATTVSASITMPPAPEARTSEIDTGNVRIAPTEPVARDVANLVHAGIRSAGRDADDSMMMVTMSQGQAYLDIKTPKERGFERFTLPGHDRIEAALSKVMKAGTLEVDYADRAPEIRATDARDLNEMARRIGVDVSDFGIAAPEGGDGKAKERVPGAMAAAIMSQGMQR